MPNPDRPNVLDHLSSLRRYALSLTRHESEAEDLVHDALVRAYEQRASYRQSGNLSGWLMSILHNTFIDGVRSRKAAVRRDAQVSVVLERLMPAPQDDSLRVSQIRNAFNNLPDDQRAAIHLVAIEGQTYAEAASVLGIPIGTLMSRISRAREQLRAIEDGTNVVPLRIVGGKNDRP